MKSKKVLALCMAAVFSVLSFAGCASKSQGTASKNSNEGKKLEKVKVVQPAMSELWSAAYTAKLLGYYEEEGLDVEFTTVSEEGGIASLLSGKADIGLLGYEMVLMFNEQGKNIKMINATTGKFPYALVTKPEIKTMADLKGKTVITDGVPSSGDAFVKRCIKSAGLEPNKDVVIKDASTTGGAAVAAMQSKDIYGLHTYGVNKAELVGRGCNVLVDMADAKTHNEILGSPTYEMYITCTTADTIKKKPETVQKFQNAMYRASLWQQKHSGKEIADTLMKLFPERKGDNLEKSLTEMKDFLSKEGELTLTGHEAANKIAKESGMIKGDVSREKVVDDSFFKKAKEKYGNK